MKSPWKHNKNDSNEDKALLYSAYGNVPNEGTGMFFPDTPLRDSFKDRFERYPIAKKIAAAISKRRNEGSIVMGIYGMEGEGKTSLLNLIEQETGKYSHLITIRIDLLRFNTKTQLIKGFFTELTNALYDSGIYPNSDEKKLIKLINAYSDLLAPEIKTGVKANFRGKKLSPTEALGQIRNNIDDYFRKADRRILVLADDLEKMGRDEIQVFLRIIKLSANFPHSVYVLALDEQSVAGLLGGGLQGAQKYQAGRKILQKIVQVPVRIPPVEKKSLMQFVSENINGLLDKMNIPMSDEQKRTFAADFDEGFGACLKTIGIVRRYINCLAFAFSGPGSNLNAADLMLVEGLRFFYPGLYNTVRENPEIFTGVEFQGSARSEFELNQARTVVSKGLEGLNEAEKDAAVSVLLHLFPGMGGIFNSSRVRNVLNPWLEAKPAASRQYFGQYFKFPSPDEDFFEREMGNLLMLVEPGGIDELAFIIRQLVRDVGADKVISGIRDCVRTFSPVSSGKLIKALGQSGGSFSNPDSLFSFSTVYSHPAILIKELLENVFNTRDRFFMMRTLLLEAEPVSFAFECLRWIRSAVDAERLFSVEEEEKLSGILVDRIKRLSQKYPIYINMPQDTPLLLSVWSFLGSREDTTRYLAETFEKNPENAIEFLKCYMPEEWAEGESLELNENFLRDQYNTIAGVVDSDLVYTNIMEANKHSLVLTGSFATPLKQLTAGFVQMHKRNNEEDQLRVFSIREFENSGEIKAKPAAEGFSEENTGIKKSTLIPVGKGVYRPVTELFS